MLLLSSLQDGLTRTRGRLFPVTSAAALRAGGRQPADTDCGKKGGVQALTRNASARQWVVVSGACNLLVQRAAWQAFCRGAASSLQGRHYSLRRWSPGTEGRQSVLLAGCDPLRLDPLCLHAEPDRPRTEGINFLCRCRSACRLLEMHRSHFLASGRSRLPLRTVHQHLRQAMTILLHAPLTVKHPVLHRGWGSVPSGKWTDPNGETATSAGGRSCLLDRMACHGLLKLSCPSSEFAVCSDPGAVSWILARSATYQ